MVMKRIAVAVTGVFLGVCALDSAAECQDLRALARAHAAKSPDTPLEMTGPPGDYRPKDIKELASESDVVLRGTLTPIDTYLGQNEDRILTDYRIEVQQLIAGGLPPTTSKTPGKIPPRVVTVYGGVLRVEGVLVRAIDPNLGEVVPGKSYLLFLMPSRRGDAGYYEIYHGGIFEMSGNRLIPILKDGRRAFKDIADSTLEDVIDKIRAARSKLP